MIRGKASRPLQDLVEQSLEEVRRAAVHRVRQGGAGHGLHSQVIKPSLIRQKPLLDFPEGVLPRDLRVQTGQELPPRGEALAVMVAAPSGDRRIKTMSRNEVE